MPYIGRGPVKSGAFRILDDISGSFNGSTTTFALTVASTALTVGLPETLTIAVDGVVQEPGSAFTISGSNIVFGSAPQAAATFWGVELGDVGGLADRAVTQSANDNTTKVSTTAYVQTELGDYATLASPTLTGNPIAPTQSAGNNSTRIATTAYVDTQVATEDTLAEMGDVNLTSPGDAAILVYDTGTSTWRDAAVSGDATIGDTGAVTVASSHSGSAHHADSHTVVSHSDTTATGGNLNTLVGGGATTLHVHTIADDSIVEAKLDVSNGPTNGQFLQAQSGGGGLTWATVAGATPAKVMAYQI